MQETLVVDCSVAAKWALQESGRSDALRLLETRPLLGRALDLAINGQMSLWDCVYLALAIEQIVN